MSTTPLSLLPVVVIYRCGWQEAQSIQSLLKHYSGKIFVGDNSPQDFTARTEPLPNNILYHRAANNPGLAHHYNAAAHYAAAHGFTHLLLLDQDTVFPPNALDVYLQLSESTIIAAPSLSTNVGAFSPSTIDTWQVKAVELQPGSHSLFHFAPVNSGLCVRVEDFLAVGGYNEAVKLDFADYQFIRRIRQRNSTFVLLSFTARQDFSNHQTDVDVLLPRYRLYLESARHCEFNTIKSRWQHHYQVLRHTIALTLRTRSSQFLVKYLTEYL